MSNARPIHPDFQILLGLNGKRAIELFKDLRLHILEIYPECNELLYHTHALTSVFSVFDKLSDAFCHIPIYSEQINLGFNKGALLKDEHGLLQGTGKLIRHIRVTQPSDFKNPKVERLVSNSIGLALEDIDSQLRTKGKTISKIKL